MALPYQEEQKQQQQNQQTAIQPNQSISPGSQFIKTSQGIQKAAMRRSSDVAASREAAPQRKESDIGISTGAQRLLEAAKAKRAAVEVAQPQFKAPEVETEFQKQYKTATTGIKVDPNDIIKGPRFTVGNTTYVTKNPDTAKGEVLIDPANPNNNKLITDILTTLDIKQNPDSTFTVNGKNLTAPAAYAELFNIQLGQAPQQGTPEQVVTGTTIEGPTNIASGAGAIVQPAAQAITSAVTKLEQGQQDQLKADTEKLGQFEAETKGAFANASATAISNTIASILTDQNKQIKDVTAEIEKLAFTEDGKKALMDLSKNPEELKKALTAASTPAERMAVMQELSRLRDLGILVTQEQAVDEIGNWKQASNEMYGRLDEARDKFIAENKEALDKALPQYAGKELAKSLENFSRSITEARSKINADYEDFRKRIIEPVVSGVKEIKAKLEQIPADQEAAAKGRLVEQALKIAGEAALPENLANADLKTIYGWAEKSWQNKVLNSPEYKTMTAQLSDLTAQDAKLNKFLENLATRDFSNIRQLTDAGLTQEQATQLERSRGLDITGDNKVDAADLQELNNISATQNQIAELKAKGSSTQQLQNNLNSQVNVIMGTTNLDYSSPEAIRVQLQRDPKVVDQVLGGQDLRAILDTIRVPKMQQAATSVLQDSRFNNVMNIGGISAETLRSNLNNIINAYNSGKIGEIDNIIRNSVTSQNKATDKAAKTLQEELIRRLQANWAIPAAESQGAFIQAAAAKVLSDAQNKASLGNRTPGESFANYSERLAIQDANNEQQAMRLQAKINRAAKLEETFRKMASANQDLAGQNKQALIESIKKLGK